MNSFMSWIGGKKALRDEIVVRFPAHYSRYIEVFGGGGWVLFHKAPGNDFEVYNDFNPNLANLYRCVRDHPDELCDELRYTLNSRADFDHIRNMLHTQTEIPDIRRAAYFYQLIRESYLYFLFNSNPQGITPALFSSVGHHDQPAGVRIERVYILSFRSEKSVLNRISFGSSCFCRNISI